MNIQKIYNAQIYTVQPIRYSGAGMGLISGVTITQPSGLDTVSFRGKVSKTSIKDLAALARKEARAMRDAKQIAEAKTAPTKKNLSGEERKQGVSRSTAKQIHDMISKPQKIIENFMDEIFGDLIV